MQGKKTGNRLLSLFMGIILLFVLPCVSYGAGLPDSEDLAQKDERVFDYAGLFSAEEVSLLEEEAARLRQEYKAEFVVLTVDDAKWRTAQETADEFYFSYGFDQSFGEDGALVLVDMDNREIYLGTYGMMIQVITDRRLERILDKAYPAAAQGKYALAAMTMLGETGNYVQKGIVAGQYNYDTETGRISVHHTIRWYEALAALVISTVLGGMACAGVRRRYQMNGDNGADSRLAYQNTSGMYVQPHTDLLLNTAVHHTVIPRHTTSSRSSGGSSARRSSTHSHHGHRAGGGGRKF